MDADAKAVIRDRLSVIRNLATVAQADLENEFEGSLLKRLEWIQKRANEALQAHIDSLNSGK